MGGWAGGLIARGWAGGHRGGEGERVGGGRHSTLSLDGVLWGISGALSREKTVELSTLQLREGQWWVLLEGERATTPTCGGVAGGGSTAAA